MKKIAVVLLVVLTFSSGVEARPHPISWVKHHERIVGSLSALTAGSIVQFKGTTYCSRGDVERCIEGYGSRRAFDYFSIGMGAAMFFVSEKCHKEDCPKPAYYALAYWVPTTQVSLGVHDFVSYAPEKDRKSESTLLFHLK